MNTGFFCNDDKPCISRGDEKPKVKKIKELKKVGCDSCGLHHKCNSPKMGIQGKGQKKILVIIDSPGANDDKTGKYLSGSSGKIVTDIINLHCNLKNDCWIMGAVQCHSEKEQKGIAVRACSSKVQDAIKKLQPAVILTFGKLAIDSVVDHKMTGRLSGLSLGDWVGYAIPDQEYKCFICPSWNTSLLLNDRNDENKVIKRQMYSHIYKAISLADKPFYTHNYKSDAVVIEDKDEAISLLRTMQEKQFVAFDYETTGIKPYREGHKIKTASVSDGFFGYAFPFFEDEDFRIEWKNIMTADTGKIAHNAKFESLWTKNRAGINGKGGYWPKNIVACTMLNAHIIQNKKKCNLKFLTYVHFGVAGYDASVDSFLEASKEEQDKYGANSINRIDDAPIKELLLYNALDSLFTYKLWEIQKTELIPNLTSNGAAFFLDSTLELAKAENTGLLLDVPNAELEYKKLTKKMERIEYKINISDELKKWDKEKCFRVSAPGDLTHLLFDCMKVKANKDDLTPTGKPKADIEAMGKYDFDIVKNTLQWRKYKKVRDTYLNGFIKEATDGVIHTSLNLHTVDTFRSSSNDPNLQNIPARDFEVMNLLRKLLIARPNHKIIEYDYKAMEACLDGNTLIKTISGKMKIKDIALNYKNKDIYVYCYNNDKKRIGVSKVIAGKKTGINKEVLKIVLDNGKHIIATPNHNFMLRDGTYKEAKDLIVGQSMMPFYSKVKHSKETGVNYKQIELNNGKKIMGHNLIAMDLFNTIITGSGKCVHHKDHNGMNNDLDNIEIISRKKHMQIHAIDSWTKPKKKRTFEYNRSPQAIKERTDGYFKWFNALTDEQKKEITERAKKTRGSQKGINNPMYGKKHTKEAIEKNKLSHIGISRLHTEETKKKLSKIMKNRKITWGEAISAGKLKANYITSDETKKKISIAGKGRIVSKKTKKLLSENKKKWWAEKKLHNHKIVKITKVKNRDVYNITVEGTHNYATEAGIIVKNCIIACYNKDPNWIKYVSDISSDMHRDMGAKLYIRKKEAVLKSERQCAKNGFVFPTIYGSYWKNTAANLWDDCEEETKIHLKSEGIKTLDDMRSHVKKIERWFWEDQFPFGYEWMNKAVANYEQHGYITLLSGFKCYGPLSRNQIVNTPVQGTASHCKLWTLNRVSKLMTKKKMNSKIMLEIHDSIIPDVDPAEETYLDYQMWLYGTQKIREYWPWLIVPLFLEKKVSAINGNWAEMENMGLLKGER